MAQPDQEFAVPADFKTLWVLADWIEQHCIVPDGFHKGEPFELSPWQLWCTVNHYRVRADAVFDLTTISTQFVHRRSQIVAPQKAGKGPWTATIVCAEAVGPTVFSGFVQGDELYVCAEHGCISCRGCSFMPASRCPQSTTHSVSRIAPMPSTLPRLMACGASLGLRAG